MHSLIWIYKTKANKVPNDIMRLDNNFVSYNMLPLRSTER